MLLGISFWVRQIQIRVSEIVDKGIYRDVTRVFGPLAKSAHSFEKMLI